ncbi:MAG: tripartite tricarboxylate transporter permease [Pseudomonadales bacterium]
MLVFAGCAAGTLIGMLPGLGSISAIALMIPITYGFEPSSGINFLLLAMATFAVSEAVMMVLKRNQKSETITIQVKSMKLTKEEVKSIAPVIARSSVLGFLIGVLPSAGATIASFLAYGAERSLAKPSEKEQFGKGSKGSGCSRNSQQRRLYGLLRTPLADPGHSGLRNDGCCCWGRSSPTGYNLDLVCLLMSRRYSGRSSFPCILET